MGQTIREYMAENGLSRSAFAKMMKTAPGTISYLVNGTRNPSFDLVLQIIRTTNGAIDANGIVKPYLEKPQTG